MAREADAGRPPARRPRADTHPAGEVQERRHRFGFIRESWAELKKVEWPGQNQVIQGTAVVLIACAIVGVYLWANDLVWKRVVQNLFLGQ